MAECLVALGANLDSARFGSPVETVTSATRLLSLRGLRLCGRSRWYRSPPWPPSGQPWYVNGVARFETLLTPGEVMTILHGLETEAGRRRQHPNQARALDLDLIDYDGRVSLPPVWPRLPHPRLAERAFVLRPLADVAPHWRDPRDGRPLAGLLADIDPADSCRPVG